MDTSEDVDQEVLSRKKGVGRCHALQHRAVFSVHIRSPCRLLAFQRRANIRTFARIFPAFNTSETFGTFNAAEAAAATRARQHRGVAARLGVPLRSGRRTRPASGPRTELLERRGGTEHERVFETPADDLETNRKPARRPTGRNGNRRLAAV